MTLQDLPALLRANSYPGRGIVLGKAPDGSSCFLAYFIMGRSENSRNRIFVEEGAGLRTQAHDPAKLTDPSLVIYSPLRMVGDQVVVTNGDQTDTVCEFLRTGGGFEEALRTRTFEPDPMCTPRISGMADLGGSFSYRLSILKSAGGNPASAQRFFYEYETPLEGQGHFIHTYQCDGDPIPSFQGEPVPVAIPQDAAAFARALWESLDRDNKVSLYVRSIPLDGGQAQSHLFNRNLGD